MLTPMSFGDRPEYTKLMGVCDQVMRRKMYDRKTPLDWEPESEHHHRTASVPFATLIGE
uniref:Uncharacterized protein n=1 Tax=Romanomermis culicivorax TaxID=13658 RepID=A0A915K8G5_ROMCU